MNRSEIAQVEIVPVAGAAMLKRFIRMPYRLHRDDPNYIAPLEIEREQALSPRHNPYFEHADAQFWLARRGGRDVGRISAQIDRLAPPVAGDKVGHFGMIAAEDDAAVIAALFATAETWLRERGCARVRGPFNLSINEETGLLVDGFDTPPMLMMGHDRAYLGPRIEALGYARAKDLLAYLYDARTPLPPAVRKRLDGVAQSQLSVRPMDMRRYREEITTITSIFNDAWANNWGFVPLTPAETEHMAKALKPVLDPELVSIVESQGQAVGFGVTLPNVNEAIRNFGGRLLPFNWARLLWRLKVTDVKSARVPLMGVRRNAVPGLSAALVPYLVIEGMRRRCLARGFREIELSWILEDNRPMRRMIESIGGRVYKTYRVYEKAL
jgi:hypothetical protein